MKKIVLLLTLPITIFVSAQDKPKLEIRSNAREISFNRINNEHKLETIKLDVNDKSDRIQHKLEKIHSRPHFDQKQDRKEHIQQREHKNDIMRDRREHRKETIQHDRK